MLRFRYITKAKTSPRGKDAILIHAMPEDAAMAERIVNAILGENDGIRYACWLAEDPEKVFAEYTEPEMSEMQIYLPLITERYLETAQRYPADGSAAQRTDPETRIYAQTVSELP